MANQLEFILAIMQFLVIISAIVAVAAAVALPEANNEAREVCLCFNGHNACNGVPC
jgi:hypothetical protein